MLLSLVYFAVRRLLRLLTVRDRDELLARSRSWSYAISYVCCKEVAVWRCGGVTGSC